jgi:hypothetical protein
MHPNRHAALRQRVRERADNVDAYGFFNRGQAGKRGLTPFPSLPPLPSPVLGPTMHLSPCDAAARGSRSIQRTR